MDLKNFHYEPHSVEVSQHDWYDFSLRFKSVKEYQTTKKREFENLNLHLEIFGQKPITMEAFIKEHCEILLDSPSGFLKYLDHFEEKEFLKYLATKEDLIFVLGVYFNL